VSASTREETGERGNEAPTRLQAFLETNHLRTADLVAKSGLSRQGVLRIRKGSNLRLSTMRQVLAGVRLLTGRAVRMEEVFDLEPEGGGMGRMEDHRRSLSNA
jgi:predicted transcriptional regulator